MSYDCSKLFNILGQICTCCDGMFSNKQQSKARVLMVRPPWKEDTAASACMYVALPRAVTVVTRGDWH